MTHKNRSPATEVHLQTAIQVSNISVWEYDVTSGAIVFYRDLAPLLGYNGSEIPAHISAWEALTHPDDLPRVKEAVARHFRGKAEKIDVEYRVRGSDGMWRWLHTIGQVVARDGDIATLVCGTHSDITDRRAAQDMVRLQGLAIDAATNAIIIVDAQASDQPIVHVNPAFERLTGYSAAEVLGRNCRFLQGADREQPDIARLRHAIALGKHSTALLRNYRKDGTLFWNSLRVAPVRNPAGTVTHFVGIQTDVSELKTYQAELEYRANYDTLTGLANRNVLNERITHALQLAERAQHSVGVVYLDVDRVKFINDSFGHSGGDTALKIVANRMRSCVREADTVARMGGDEFVVILEGMRENECAAVATRMVKSLQEPISIHDQDVFLSASIGIAMYPMDGSDSESLLRNADTAMYHAKRRGGNEIFFYAEHLNTNAMLRLRMEADLRHALLRDEFELHYQPRIDLTTGQVSSMEALVRWRHPSNGLVPPAHFIPLAEETGLIVPLGLCVLRAACQQMQAWITEGKFVRRVAVNLSARQFRQPDLIAAIEAILRETSLDGSHLELEITEGVAMQDPASTRASLKMLTALGVTISIDDFGTGYSSLAYLKRFPIQYLKIDRSFVRGIPEDHDDCSIVRSIIALGKSLNLSLIAEGVETEDQCAFLRAEGCDEAQGYFFCRPQPAADFASFLPEDCCSRTSSCCSDLMPRRRSA